MTKKIESKIELTNRLRREGRDQEALRYREQVREQLRAEGKTRKEAREASWEATRMAFPPLPSSNESTPAIVPTADVVQAQDPPVDTNGEVADEDWVIQWFSPLSAIAEWQAKHDVNLTDEALEELLKRQFGFGFAWAWLLGARGDLPPSVDGLTDDSPTRVTSLIDRTFEKIAEAVTVEDLAGFRSTAVTE